MDRPARALALLAAGCLVPCAFATWAVGTRTVDRIMAPDVTEPFATGGLAAGGWMLLALAAGFAALGALPMSARRRGWLLVAAGLAGVALVLLLVLDLLWRPFEIFTRTEARLTPALPAALGACALALVAGGMLVAERVELPADLSGEASDPRA